LSGTTRTTATDALVDPLDAMAHKRPSTSLAEIVDMSERDVIDSAVRLTSGCEAGTFPLSKDS
jgi:hypothetical protein